MADLIDISGIDKDLLLQKLWENSQPARIFNFNNMPSPAFDICEAKRMLRDGYADYVCGRVIKTDIYNYDQVDPHLYDRDNGTGAFQRAVDQSMKNSN